jgi:ATP-dependent Clp protease ATP-binding subunit ClpB
MAIASSGGQEARQEGFRRKKKMGRLNIALDPTKTGREAENLETNLRKYIVGQDEAIQQIVNIYQMHLTGMNPPGRPIGNFLFLGPTGSGKTRIVEAAAEALVKNPRAVIKIDCAEFQHSHEIAKLIGSPPGYLGHRETHPLLSQEVLNQYHTDTVKISFVLFDEIEKASDALWNLLLGILDKGTLTLGDNRKVDFSKALIFMTSNLGASEMAALVTPRLGFNAVRLQEGECVEVRTDNKLNDKVAKSGVEAARRKFTPEFMNRLDKVVVFRPLGTSELKKILDIELNLVQQRIFNSSPERAFVFHVTETGKDFLLREGTDQKYGARHLKRAIERLLVQPMSNLIATEQVRAGDWLRIDFEPDAKRLVFLKDAEGLPVRTMAELVDNSIAFPLQSLTSGAMFDAPRVAGARNSKRA